MSDLHGVVLYLASFFAFYLDIRGLLCIAVSQYILITPVHTAHITLHSIHIVPHIGTRHTGMW